MSDVDRCILVWCQATERIAGQDGIEFFKPLQPLLFLAITLDTEATEPLAQTSAVFTIGQLQQLLDDLTVILPSGPVAVDAATDVH